jgi:hypothetical protein
MNRHDRRALAALKRTTKGETMKLSNLDLIQSIPALSLLGQLHLPVKTSFSLGQIMRQANGLNQDYEGARLKLIDQFAKKDDGGKVIEEKDVVSGQMVAVFADREGFDADLKVLQSIEVEVTGDPVKLDDLGNVNLPANILAALHWLVVA